MDKYLYPVFQREPYENHIKSYYFGRLDQSAAGKSVD